MIDLSKITTNGKALFLAYDQGLEHGPTDFNNKNIDPNYILDIGIRGGFNAIIFQKGVAEKYYPAPDGAGQVHSDVPPIPLIVKLNGKTNLIKDEDPYSPLLCTVDEAVALGAVGVGYTIYVGSEYESKMASEFSGIVRDAHAKDIPVVAWMYLRGKSILGKDEKELTAYAARMGLELGADIIKIKYPGNLESLKKAVKAAGKTKVVVSGGSKEDEAQFLEMAKNVVASGAIGMAVGRNIWQDEHPMEIAEKLKKIILV